MRYPKVTGGSDLGGLVGTRSGTRITVSDSYWDTQTSTLDTSAGGTSKTTVELQSPITNRDIYANWQTSDWDFGNTTQYPLLKYAPNPDTSGPKACDDDGCRAVAI